MAITAHDDYDEPCPNCGDAGCEQCCDEEDEPVSMNTVQARARARFGNTELAREAAEMYPGDFI